ncbi:MAG: S8 family serine peptidase, partial [Bacteroidaceae bacterium]|nr:S8 family serine peptidase [Bacteroidaceae bacterium]
MKRILFLYLLLMVSLAGRAQGEAIRTKLSATTRMLMSELREKESAGDRGGRRTRGRTELPDEDGEEETSAQRSYAEPVMIDGRSFVSSFLRLRDGTDVRELEARGVRIQSRFKNGLVTAWIPVDGIEEVAEVENVMHINVSPVAMVHSDAARRETRVEDILTQSEVALNAGVTGKYDGSGVLLAIIDIGIDFQHIAFRDSAGGYRMKAVYLYDGRDEHVYDSFESLTTDSKTNDHGSHVASLAGGSSVVVEGDSMRVTNDHGHATYGGMAPGADLYLCGFNKLEYAHIANAIQKVCEYADAHGQPVVVCNSWGSQDGPHDGSGELSEVIDQYFGDDHPNHICLFASGNYAGYSQKGAGGGFYVTGEGSSEHPLRTIVNHNNSVNTSDSYSYGGNKTIASAWTRSHMSKDLACRVYVLDTATGNVLDSMTVTQDNASMMDSEKRLYAKVSFSTYYSGYLQVYFDESVKGAKSVKVKSMSMSTKKKHAVKVNGSTFTVSDCTLAMGLFPVEGSELIDMWAGLACYFSNHLTTEGYEWTAGTDDFSVTDESTYANAISVGAYVTKNVLTDYKGVVHDASNDATLGLYDMGDIAYFTSYAVPGVGSTVVAQPVISAPGAVLVGAVNHYNSASNTSYLADVLSGSGKYRMNGDVKNPYGSMSGTSMSTPVAAGTVALWLQAAQEVGKSLTVNDVKRIMVQTAVHDAFTDGEKSAHFGSGKLDALAGLQYILGVNPPPKPAIIASVDTLTFSSVVGDSIIQELVITGEYLTDSIKVDLVDSLGVFVLDSIYTKIVGKADGDTIQITFKSSEEGEFAGQLVLSSTGADSVFVALKAIASPADTIPEQIPSI